MIILTIDSALDTFCAAVSEDDRVLCETFCRRPRAQLRCLARAVDDTLATAGVGKSDVNLVGVTKGPGSFTGIRLAETTAMTCAQILSAPVSAICTLDAVQASLPCSGSRTAVAFDARRGEIFSAVYLNGERLTGYEALSPEGFVEFALNNGVESVAGNALERYGEMIRSGLPGATIYPDYFWYPHGNGMAALSLDLFKKGEATPYSGVPQFYMRLPEAEEARERRLREGKA